MNAATSYEVACAKSRLISSKPRSVFDRLINQSLWPDILGTDTAGTIEVNKRIRSMSALPTILTILMAISSALTSLGLHTTFRLRDVNGTPFSYSRDNSAIGQWRPSRDGYEYNESAALTPDAQGTMIPMSLLQHHRLLRHSGRGS